MKNATHLCLVSVALALSSGMAIAQESHTDVVDSDAIADALTKPRTRGLTRAIGVSAKSKVDLNIPFEINSSELAPDAQRQLAQLRDALSRDSLATLRIQIAGHTDSSGAADYNRQLSERRANTVMRYLIDNGIEADRLEAVGYGEEMPLMTNDPGNPANRRVEIRNLGSSTEH